MPVQFTLPSCWNYFPEYLARACGRRDTVHHLVLLYINGCSYRHTQDKGIIPVFQHHRRYKIPRETPSVEALNVLGVD